MLSLLKKLTAATPAPAPAQPVAPVADKVDPYMLGLYDAKLSGWFNAGDRRAVQGLPGDRR